MVAWRLAGRIARRNLGRRRLQTLVILAGLLVGTATVTASLSVADSLRYGIHRAALDGFGPADEFVQINGQPYFPQSVAAALANDSTVRAASPSPVVIDTASARGPNGFVPATGLAGFDAALDAPYGDLTTPRGARIDPALADHDAILGESLAAQIGAKVGDSVTLGVHAAGPPTRTDSIFVRGNITGAGSCAPPPPAPLPSPTPAPVPLPVNLTKPCAYNPDATNASTFSLPIGRGSIDITVVLEPGGSENSPTRPDLDIVAVAPSGNQTVADAGLPDSPSDPAYLDVKGAPYLERGNWQVRVTTKAGAAASWGGFIYVTTAVYDPAQGKGPTAGSDIINDADAAVYAAAGSGKVVFDNFTVKAVAAHEGKGAFVQRTGVFLSLAAAQRLTQQEGNVNAVKLADGGRAASAANAVLDAQRAAHPDDPAYDHLAVAPVKSLALAAADQEGGFYREFLTAVSALTVLAGALLVVHVFVLLASERQREMGTARALGLSRGDVVASFFAEGALLAMLAAFAGVVVGLLGALGILLAFDFILQAVGNGQFGFVFHPEPLDLLLAAALGFILMLAAAAFAAWRVSGFSVVDAQRGSADFFKGRDRRASFWLALGAVSLVAGALCYLSGSPELRFAALCFAPWLAVALLSPIARRPLWAGVTLVLVALATLAAIPPAGGVGRVLGLLRGVTLAGGILLAGSALPIERWIESALSRIRRLRAVGPLAARSPLRRRAHTGLTVSLFAFVMLVLVFFSILGTTFTLNLDEEKGGYDLYATAQAPAVALSYVPSEPLAAAQLGVLRNLTIADPLLVVQDAGGDHILLDGARVHHKGAPVDNVYAFGPDFVKHERFAFTELDPAYKDGRSAFDAVLHDPALAIISTAYTLDETGNPGAHHVGSTLTLRAGTGDATMRVIGVVKEVYLGGVWVHPIRLRTSYQTIQGGFLIGVARGQDPAALAPKLDAVYAPAGLHAVDLQTAAALALEQNEQFLRMFQMFLGFGLVLGIASLGVVTARSAIERRRQIGIVRALGLSRMDVALWLILEALLLALLGTIVGLLSGTALAFATWLTTIRPTMMVPFQFSYIVIPAILLMTYAAAALAAFGPAWKASGGAPADSVRSIE